MKLYVINILILKWYVFCTRFQLQRLEWSLARQISNFHLDIPKLIMEISKMAGEQIHLRLLAFYGVKGFVFHILTLTILTYIFMWVLFCKQLPSFIIFLLFCNGRSAFICSNNWFLLNTFMKMMYAPIHKQVVINCLMLLNLLYKVLIVGTCLSRL